MADCNRYPVWRFLDVKYCGRYTILFSGIKCRSSKNISSVEILYLKHNVCYFNIYKEMHRLIELLCSSFTLPME